MSRFDQGRWNRILVWTGATLAWGTALVGARAEPAQVADSVPPSQGQVAADSARAGMPTPPSQGLVILRFTPVKTPEPEVVTVSVTRAAVSPAPAQAAAAAAQPVPEPSSSGS
ncbi:MAG TPA: hypothetical protein VK990_05960 [Acidimicrobiia bacterium]|nr:hypothetical protein [Acidimicrobiia bacterium]